MATTNETIYESLSGCLFTRHAGRLLCLPFSFSSNFFAMKVDFNGYETVICHTFQPLMWLLLLLLVSRTLAFTIYIRSLFVFFFRLDRKQSRMVNTNKNQMMMMKKKNYTIKINRKTAPRSLKDSNKEQINKLKR